MIRNVVKSLMNFGVAMLVWAIAAQPKMGAFSSCAHFVKKLEKMQLIMRLAVDKICIIINICSQVHMLIDCPQLAEYRDTCSLGTFINAHRKIMPSISSVKIYALYLSDRYPEDIKKKAYCLYSMKCGWLIKMG